jgi:hypothetical protein
MNSMEPTVIHHPPRAFHSTLSRLLEIESECPDCPEGEPGLWSRCPDCDSVMVYRGIGRLGSGTRVHYYECVHSHREVHSLSIVIAE